MKKATRLIVFAMVAVTLSIILGSWPAMAVGVLKVYTHTDISENEKWVPTAEKAIGARIELSPRMSANGLWSRV